MLAHTAWSCKTLVWQGEEQPGCWEASEWSLDVGLPWKKSSAGWTGFFFCLASVGFPQGKPAQRQTCHPNSAGLRLSHLKPHTKSPEINEEALKWTLEQAHSKPSVISLPIYHWNVCNSPQGDFLVFKQLLPCIISSCFHKREEELRTLC